MARNNGRKHHGYPEWQRRLIFETYQKDKETKTQRQIAKELEIGEVVFSQLKKTIWWKELSQAI